MSHGQKGRVTMVGGFKDKVEGFASNTEPSPPESRAAATPRPRIEIQLDAGQLDAIRAQWSERDRNAPAELVFKVGPEVVGRVEAVSSLFVSRADAVGGAR